MFFLPSLEAAHARGFKGGKAFGAAALAKKKDAVNFQHVYSDPLHPLCERKIVVDGSRAIISGSDVGHEGAGCSESEVTQYTLQNWTREGKIDGTKISADGSPPLDGSWDKEGILWSDGTRWEVVGDA